MSKSKADLLTLLRGRTILDETGFGAVWVMSRSRLNQMLEAQYVERFARRDYLPLISGEVVSTKRRVRVRVANLELGAPRLSFDNASMSDSQASVHLPVVSGRLQVFERLPGAPKACVVDCVALEGQGMEVVIRLDLNRIEGVIDGYGQISLDMRQVNAIQCELDGWDASWGECLGRLIKAQLANVPVDRSTFRLNLIDYRGLSLLAPVGFRIRTQAAPGARVRGARNYGDGAVVVFLQLAGDPQGGVVPGGSFPFLLPDDTQGGELVHTFSLLFARSVRGAGTPALGQLMVADKYVLQNIERHADTQDLVHFGRIEPHRSRFQVEPQMVELAPGGVQQFTLRDTAGRSASVTGWRCLGRTNHTSAAAGSIVNGRYQAAARGDFGHDRLEVWVIADYEFEGERNTACARVHVNFEAMAVQANARVAVGDVVQVRPLSLDGASAPALALAGPVRGQMLDASHYKPFVQGRSLAVQAFAGARQGQQAQSALVIRSGKLRVSMEDALEPVKPGGSLSISEQGQFLAGLPRHTYVAAGDGTLSHSNARYTAPDSTTPGSAVIVREVQNGKGVILANNFVMVRQSAVETEKPWTTVSVFKFGAGEGYADKAFIDGGGYQQLHLKVAVQVTRTEDGIPVSASLSQEEMDSLEFRGVSSHAVVGVLDPGAEHIASPLAYGDWRLGARNKFDLASTDGVVASEINSDEQVIDKYLHCVGQNNEAVTLYAAFRQQGLVGGWHDSLEKTRQLTVTAKDASSRTRAFLWNRVGQAVREPTLADFINDPMTKDLWTLTLNPVDSGLPVDDSRRFRRVDFKINGESGKVSTLHWLTTHAQEDALSRTGVIFNEKLPAGIALSDEQSARTFNGNSVVWDSGIHELSPGVKADRISAINDGDIAFVLERLFNDVAYGAAGNMSGFSNFNKTDLNLQLIDQGGRVYRFSITWGNAPGRATGLHSSYVLRMAES